MRVWTEQPSFRANSNNRFHRCVCVHVFLYRCFFSLHFWSNSIAHLLLFAFCFNWMCVSISICLCFDALFDIYKCAPYKSETQWLKCGQEVVSNSLYTQLPFLSACFRIFSSIRSKYLRVRVRMICLHYTFQQSKSNFVSFRFGFLTSIEQRWMLWKALTKLSYLMALFKLIFHFHFIWLSINSTVQRLHTIDNVRLPWQSILTFSSGFHWIRMCI